MAGRLPPELTEVPPLPVCTASALTTELSPQPLTECVLLPSLHVPLGFSCENGEMGKSRHKATLHGRVGEEREQLTKVGRGSIVRVRVPPACFAWFLTFPLGSVYSAESLSPYTAWISAVSDTDALLAEWDKGGIVTVDMGGRVRLWETGLERLQQSLMEWRNMIGQDSDRPLQVSLD